MYISVQRKEKMLKLKTAQTNPDIKSVLSNFEEMRIRVQRVSAIVETLISDPNFQRMSFEEFLQIKSAEGIDMRYLLTSLGLI